MSAGRNERCPCGSGEEYERCCLPRASHEEQFQAFWERVFAPGLRELVEARLRAIYERTPATGPLFLDVFLATGLEQEFAESERARIAADVMAVTPHLWGDEFGADLNRLVPVRSLSPNAQVVARSLASSRLGVWGVYEDDDGRILVKSVAASDEQGHAVVARMQPTDALTHPPCEMGVGWLVSVGGVPVYIEHLGLDPDAADALVLEGIDCCIIDADDLSAEEADLELARLALELYIQGDPALAQSPFSMMGSAEGYSLILRDPREQTAVVGRTLTQLTQPGPACRALLWADTEEALLEAVRDARWRGDSWHRRIPRDPEIEAAVERRVPAPAILETLRFSGDAVFAEERRLATLPVALLGVEESVPGGGVRAGSTIRAALEAASGRAREELETAWRTYRAEQRGLRLLTTISQEISMRGLLRAISYELARWLLVDIAPGEVGDTPLAALPIPQGALGRLLTGLCRAYDLPHEPRLRDLPTTYRELKELKGVGPKSHEELVAALTSHLRDWRSHRAGLTPEQLLGGSATDPEAAAALEAGLTDLEALFT